MKTPLRRLGWLKWPLVLSLSLCLGLTGCAKSTPARLESENVQEEIEQTLATIPAYTGDPYVEINNNVPFFEEEEWTTKSFQEYFDLDELGRVSQAYACLGTDLMPDLKRQDISSVKPTGFINQRYSFLKDGMLYNRCHLIAFMLAGQNANPKNLMTGTRYLNIEGMLPFEDLVHDYIEETGNHVMYRVTPVFEGDDLVARGVIMEGYSVEDQGQGIEFCVYCYNVQPGVAINYTTGENQVDTSMSEDEILAFYEAPRSTKQPNANNTSRTSQTSLEVSDDEVVQTYIINTNSKKFHLPQCSGAQTMNEKNRLEVQNSKAQLLKEGYISCQICMPEA